MRSPFWRRQAHKPTKTTKNSLPKTKHLFRFHPRLETLETRVLLTVYTVTNTNDLGAGSLRQALLDLDSTGTANNTIQFSISPSGPQDIFINSNLPPATRQVTIDGFSEIGTTFADPPIHLRPSDTGFADTGLALSGGSSTVRGFSIGGFFLYGILLDGNNNTVTGCFLGLQPDGVTPQGNEFGIFVESGTGDTIGGTGGDERNIISGNGTGVIVSSDDNTILNNYIGTDKTGTVAVANASGMEISGSNNVIGGTVVLARNIISGNGGSGGLQILGGTANVIEGNYIGPDAGGNPLSATGTNNTYGVLISGGSGNRIGGTTLAERNVISDNLTYGLGISVSDNNLVIGNYFGTTPDGLSAMPNSIGLSVTDGSNNQIGGTANGGVDRNVISGNTTTGLVLSGTNNVVEGNYVGIDMNGTVALANGINGIAVSGGSGNRIGGTVAAARNYISGNSGPGLVPTTGTGLLITNGAEGTLVEGNYIGTDLMGTVSMGNAISGITISGGASDSIIGGTMTEYANLISGNTGPSPTILGLGVWITGTGTSGNLIAGNFIGTDFTGTAPLANGTGIAISGGASNNIVGDPTPRGTPVNQTIGRRNIIAGNLYAGIAIFDRGTSNNFVVNNLIGNYLGNDNQNHALANGEGVDIYSAASGNRIGGYIAPVMPLDPNLTDIHGNTIAGNTREGVRIYDSGTSNNLVQGNFIGNYIGPNNQDIPLGNGIGVGLAGFCNNNLVGGTVVYGQNPDGTPKFFPAANVISGNAQYGVAIYDRRTFGNMVQSNMIGPNQQGTAALVDAMGNPIQQFGVGFYDGPVSNILGGTIPETRNIISGNAQDGVTIFGVDTASNVVMGNFIGTDVTGNQVLQNGLSNGANGVKIYASAHDNIIGGTVAGSGNLISGNTLDGVLITTIFPGPGSTRNQVLGNFIGTDFNFVQSAARDYAFANPLGNGLSGVHILDNQTNGNFVGSAANNSGNWIAFNGLDGVTVDDGIYNTIFHNNISQHPNGLGINLLNNGNTQIQPPDATAITASYSLATNMVTIDSNGNAVFTGLPNTVYTLEFFLNQGIDAVVEGERFLGSVAILTDGNGAGSTDPMNLPMYSYDINNPIMFLTISMTLTDPTGNTSQFSVATATITQGPAPGLAISPISVTPIQLTGLTTVQVSVSTNPLAALDFVYATAGPSNPVTQLIPDSSLIQWTDSSTADSLDLSAFLSSVWDLSEIS
jgi:hypothetical protein